MFFRSRDKSGVSSETREAGRGDCKMLEMGLRCILGSSDALLAAGSQFQGPSTYSMLGNNSKAG